MGSSFHPSPPPALGSVPHSHALPPTFSHTCLVKSLPVPWAGTCSPTVTEPQVSLESVCPASFGPQHHLPFLSYPWMQPFSINDDPKSLLLPSSHPLLAFLQGRKEGRQMPPSHLLLPSGGTQHVEILMASLQLSCMRHSKQPRRLI